MAMVALLILGLARGIMVSVLDISPVMSSHWWLTIPDVLLILVASSWLAKSGKKGDSLLSWLYVLCILGSVIWDYQIAFLILKVILFPVILLTILNLKRLEKSSSADVIKFGLHTVFYPFVVVITVINALHKRLTRKEEGDSPKANYILPAVVGLFLGIVILGILILLDPEFAQFLKIEKWWEYILNIITSIGYYVLIFIWYFFVPARMEFVEIDFSEHKHSLQALLRAAVVSMTAIFFAYTFYDAYILGRMFKVLSLVFESMGKNTQLYFIELVLLGGLLLLVTSFLLDKIVDYKGSDKQSVKNIILALVGSLIWLTPPVFNILRALLSVYIPSFGLTQNRIFGLYTTSAFLVSLAVVIVALILNKKDFFVRALLAFFLTIAVSSFVVPNNLIIADWHLQKYYKDGEMDFDYFRKIRLDKWGWFFFDKYDLDKLKSDSLVGMILASRSGRKDLSEKYKSRLIEEAKAEVNEMDTLITTQRFSQALDKYKGKDFWYYAGSPMPNVNIGVNEIAAIQEIEQDVNEMAQQEIGFQDHLWTSYLDVKYATQIAQLQDQSSVELRLYPNRKKDTVLRITGQANPFWLEDFSSFCGYREYLPTTTFQGYCSSYMNVSTNLKPEYPIIPEKVVRGFLAAD